MLRKRGSIALELAQAAMTIARLRAAPNKPKSHKHGSRGKATHCEKRTRPPKNRAKAYIRLSAVWLVIAR